ncbi:MAG: dephospho-CoA kinase [Bacteroidales bacterium]|nr:dephospho-CoA kinase [Bacteroidales bacterium]
MELDAEKTMVCKAIEALGFPVFYADTQARQIAETDSEVVLRVSEVLGHDIYAAGRLNRTRLADSGFNDAASGRRLNAIVHPAVARYFDDWVKLNANHSIVFEEAAILFESGANRQMDKTILIAAPVDVRVARVVARDGVSADAVMRRMANQQPQDELTKMTDFIICNNGERLVMPQLLSIIETLKLL